MRNHSVEARDGGDPDPDRREPIDNMVEAYLLRRLLAEGTGIPIVKRELGAEAEEIFRKLTPVGRAKARSFEILMQSNTDI